MKTHDDLRWDFKQETELDSVYRQNNNSQPFNEAYVKWLEDKILLANGAEQSTSNCNIPLVSGIYSDADVRNIALEMKNEAVTGLYGEERWSMQERLGKIQDKWKLRL